MRFDRGPDVGGELGVVVFESGSSASGEVLAASDAGAAFVLPECDGGSSPTESSLRSSRTAAVEPVGNLRLVESALRPGERLSRESEQIVGDSCGVVHDPTS